MSNFGKGVENRQFGRRQTQLHAWVTVPGRPRLPCIVKDLSVRGALLAFEHSPAGLPYSFKLTIEATKFETACESRHHRGNSLGVEFVETIAPTPTDRRTAGNSVEEWTGFSRATSIGTHKRPQEGRDR